MNTQTTDTQTVATQPGAKPARRRRLWPWVLLALVMAVLVSAAATAAWLMSLVSQAPQSWQVALQGEALLRQVSRLLTHLADTLAVTWPWFGGLDWHWDLDGVSVFGLTMGLLVLFVGLVLLLLGLMTLLPMLVLAIGAGSMVAVMAALLLAAAVAALALSPLWLPVLGMFWWLRRKAAAVTASTPSTAAAAPAAATTASTTATP